MKKGITIELRPSVDIRQGEQITYHVEGLGPVDALLVLQSAQTHILEQLKQQADAAQVRQAMVQAQANGLAIGRS